MPTSSPILMVIFTTFFFIQKSFLVRSLTIFLFTFDIFFSLTNLLVSTFEKRSKKSRSQSPSAPSHQTSTITSNSSTTTIIENDISSSHPIANSLESDDDAVIGASSSTTTTSSSFMRDEGTNLDQPQQLRASNCSLNKVDSDLDGGTVNDLMRYRVEQQRKGSISIVSNNQTTTSSGESKVS